jgi:hypothetical protein
MSGTLRSLIVASLVIVLASCGKNEQQTKSEKPTTSAETKSESISGDNTSITYQISGAINGTMTIMRDGKELKQIIDSEIMGMKSHNEIFIKGNTVYSITEVAGKKMAMKTSLSEYNGQKLTGETIADPREFQKLLEGKKVTGTETILGHTCEIYDLGTNVFLSVADKKSILRIKSPELLATATEISALPANSASVFELPAGVEFRMVSPQTTPSKEKLDSALKELKK